MIHKRQKKSEDTLDHLENKIKLLCDQSYYIIEEAVEDNKKIGWYKNTV